MQCLEQEVLERNDIVGVEAREFKGRGRPLVFRLAPVLPPKRRNRQAVSGATQRFGWMNTTLTELGYLLVSVARFGDSAARKTQRAGLLIALDRRARWMDKDVIVRSERSAAPLLDRWPSRGRELFLAFIGQAVSDVAETIMGVLDYIALLAKAVIEWDGKWTVATPPPRGVGAEARKPSRAAAPAIQQVMRELSPGLPGWWQCGRCLRVGQGEVEIEVLLRTPCAEHSALLLALDKLGSFAFPNGHHLWVAGPVMWCWRCGCNTKLCVRKLAVKCAGLANAKWVLTTLRQAEHRKLCRLICPLAPQCDSRSRTGF
jgi:hypothetical protein